MTGPEQIAHWLAEPEGERIEFKTASNNFHFEKLVDYCVALANEGGGKIILGVTDRRPRSVIGTAAFAEPGRTELVESHGRGRGVRYLLSRDLYSVLGRPGTYTRARGLDHETNKALLLQHLRDCGNRGAPVGELMQVLPALSRTHVKRLLEELAVEGQACKAGVTRAGRWFAAPVVTLHVAARDDA